MSKLRFYQAPLKDEEITVIASCFDNIQALQFKAADVTIRGWETLTSAISNRPTPVSRQNICLCCGILINS